MPSLHLRNLRNPRFHNLLFRRVVPLILLPFAALALLNLLVDPYGIYHLLPWASATKYKSPLGTPIAKAESLRRPGWDVILLGNSPVDVALAPTIPAWDNLHVFNAGLPGASMSQLLQVTRLALQNPDLKQIILCIDMSDFASAHTPPTDYSQSLLNPHLNHFKYYLSNLLGPSATKQSLQSLLNLLHHQIADHTPDGLATRGTPRLSRAQWQSYATSLLADLSKLQLDPNSFTNLDDLLNLTAARHVRVTIVILPTHVLWLECLKAANQWPLFENWNRQLVQRVDSHTQKFPDHPVPIITFQQFIRFTQEPLPPPGQPSQMIWWRDPVHLTVDLGNLVTDRVTNHFSHKYADAPDFSLHLTPANIDDYLKQLKKDRDAFIAQTPWITEFMRAATGDTSPRQ